MKEKTAKEDGQNFAFRLKMGEHEVELTGTHEEVMNTLRDLADIIANIDKAFEKVKPKKVATLTVKTETPTSAKKTSQQYPQISPAENFDEAILRLLETDWGKWRPRTLEELSEALTVNGKHHTIRMLTGVLMDLVKREKIRRWNTNAGYVYILAEKEAMRSRGNVE